ncbi:MAG: TerB family tellurite resistance protein [Bacteroidetes bacterium]|nr:TerB family tellurite resistance protein [Bacteroidota bacterium]
MKKICLVTVFIFLAATTLYPGKARAQSIADLIEELTLDYQKLSGLKSILSQMQQGYKIVSAGYNSVKGVAQGNFSLHEAFLDGLMMVSPTVRKYPRITEIINDQAELMTEYKSSFSQFRRDKHFSVEEISYMTDVYNNLVSQSLQNLSELTMILSDNQMRMSDNDRLQAIDRLYASGHDQLTFLRQFDNNTQSIAIQRAEQAGDYNTLQQVYGIK